MVDNSIYNYIVPLGRTIAGFFVGIMLGILGGWTAITFNHMIAFPWDPEVHRNIYFVSIGMGAGLGAFLGWMNLTARWYLVAGALGLTLLGGVAGAYLGLAYGQISDPSYLGRRYHINNMIHFGAAFGGIIVATALGVIEELRAKGR